MKPDYPNINFAWYGAKLKITDLKILNKIAGKIVR